MNVRLCFRSFLFVPTQLLTSSCILVLLVAGAGCRATGTSETDSVRSMDDLVAEQYVRLVLAVGVHDDGYVDAYYGPPEWRREAEAAKRPLAEIRADAAGAFASLAGAPEPTGEIERLRRRFLRRQLEALIARIDLLGGTRLTFDEESQALYDAVAPTHSEEDFAPALAELDRSIPGDGPLAERYAAWTEAFVIPPDRLDAVFTAAIAACRERTAARIELPPGENFRVEYVTGQPWSAYNWYQGKFQSLIQVNVDLPVQLDRAVDLACHEGYPGHHVYNALLEKHLVEDRGWIESTVYPLYSPQSFLAEGTANFGIEVAFPAEERLAFERDVLFPLAGLDPARAAEYAAVRRGQTLLSFAGNEAARRYLDGAIDAAGAAALLERYALMPAPRAAQRVRFIERYRAYVINYNAGQELVRRWVEARGGTAADPERRWQVFTELLTTPRLPSGLAADLAAGR